MGDKTEGAPQETIADVVLEMREWGDGEGCFDDNPEGKPLPCVFYTKQAWDSLCDRLARAVKPKFPELSITNVQAGSIAVIVPDEMITPEQFRHIREVIRHAATSEIKFVMLPPGTTIQALADEDLARLGLQRIPAA